MTFLQIFLGAVCLRAGWFAFNWIRWEFLYLIECSKLHLRGVHRQYMPNRGYWELL